MERVPIRVLIADDQAPFRRVVRTVIDAEDDMYVVAEAADGEEAIALTTENAPNVVLMDVRMPKLSGIEAARALNEIHPTTIVLMLTVSDEEGDLLDAIKAGASGYLLKDIDPGDIADAVRRVCAGQAVLSFAVASMLLPEIAATVDNAEHEALRLLITHREHQVLQCLTVGLSSAEAGVKLGASESVVNFHLHNLLVKLRRYYRMLTVANATTRSSSHVVELERTASSHNGRQQGRGYS